MMKYKLKRHIHDFILINGIEGLNYKRNINVHLYSDHSLTDFCNERGNMILKNFIIGKYYELSYKKLKDLFFYTFYIDVEVKDDNILTTKDIEQPEIDYVYIQIKIKFTYEEI